MNGGCAEENVVDGRGKDNEIQTDRGPNRTPATGIVVRGTIFVLFHRLCDCNLSGRVLASRLFVRCSSIALAVICLHRYTDLPTYLLQS